MKRILIVVAAIFSLSAVSALAAPPMTTDFRANLELNSKDLGLLDLVENYYKNYLSQKGESREIYPTKLRVNTAGGFAGGEGCKPAGRKDVLATLEYRDVDGVLHNTDFIVCQAEKTYDQSFVLGIPQNGEQVIAEQGFKASTWTISKDDKGVNDDGGQCDINKTIIQNVCIPEPFQVYAWGFGNIIKSSRSELQKVELDHAKPNCINVTFALAGKGFNKAGNMNLDCAEGAWFKYTVNIRGFMTGFKN